MAPLLDRAWHVDRTRQVLIVSSLLVVVLAMGFSLWGFGLLPGSGVDAGNARGGTMMFTTQDETVCKHMKFDNESFRMTTTRIGPCDESTSAKAAPLPPKGGNGSYLDSIREGFRNR
jgi:hypothetical protein